MLSTWWVCGKRSITSACSTSAHCIGSASEQIQWGKQDIVFAGGGEELDWTLSCLFDAMGAMSSKYNDAPETASRPYDATRDGFVISGGGGIVGRRHGRTGAGTRHRGGRPRGARPVAPTRPQAVAAAAAAVTRRGRAAADRHTARRTCRLSCPP